MRTVLTGCALALLLAAGCERDAQPISAPPSDAAAPADVPAAPPTPAPAIPDAAPTVAFLGDSLTAGLHLARDEAYPARLQALLAEREQPFHLMNAGVSGSTTGNGLERVGWILSREPDAVVVQLGANDGFRGVPVETIEANLRAILERVRAAGATPVLLEMVLPPNYGVDYAAAFDALFGRIARDMEVAFVPGFLEGVGGVPEMNLPDGIHPTPAGHERLAANLADDLATILDGLGDDG